MKKKTILGMVCVCKTTQQSQWTRRSNFARIWRVRQEAKPERAIFAFMIANDNAIAARSAKRRLVPDEEPCSKDYATETI